MRGALLLLVIFLSTYLDAWVLQLGMSVAHNFDARIPVPAYWAAYWLLMIPLAWAVIVLAIRGFATLLDW